jgi:hypothetical protein
MLAAETPGRSLRPIPPTDRPADPRKFVFQNSVGRLARGRLVEAPRNRYAGSANYGRVGCHKTVLRTLFRTGGQFLAACSGCEKLHFRAHTGQETE